MTTATEQLQAIADAWAERLGGKIQVSLQIMVHAGPNASKPWYCASIGTNCTYDWHLTTDKGVEHAIEESERKWRLDGAPTDPKDAERCKLKARAAELGLTVIDNNQPKETNANR